MRFWPCRVTWHLLLPLLAGLCPLSGLELKPWFTPTYELQSRATSIVQLYRSVDTCRRSVKRPAGNFFLDLQLYGTLWWPDWSVELQALAADTRHRTFGMDSISFTGRYLWMDDVVGDPVSLTSGITVYQVFKPARRDLSVFHHGGIEGELHLALGKEVSCGPFWNSRAWGVAGLGVGDQGDPWIRADAFWEHNWCEQHQLRLSLCSTWGLGHCSLNKKLRHFHGYGRIQHYSIDTGLRYSWLFNHGIMLSAEYAFRVYARNCPIHVHFILFILDYPVSL